MFIFAHLVYLKAVLVKFVFEGHPVKVKVTGAKRSTTGSHAVDTCQKKICFPVV